MGLVVDLPGSSFNVVGGSHGAPAAYAVANEVEFKMAQFETGFTFKFDPTRGIAPPTRTESWRVGVIQNVLFQKSRFVWADGTKHTKEWVTPIVDSGSVYAFPFYQDDPEYTGSLDQNQQTPFRDVYYNSKGFGEILDPWNKSPNDVVLKSSWFVTAADKPQFGCSLRTRQEAFLTIAEQIVTFGIWLVAIDSGNRHPMQVLAHVPPFTMVYSATFGSGAGMGTLEIPSSPYVFYVVKGAARTVDKRLGYVTTPGFRVEAGKGTRAPVLKGETANTRERNWAQGTILAV